MSYSYSVCYCRECECMDLDDRCSYNSNKAWCSAYHKYFNPNEHACSTYFQYAQNREKQSGGCYLTTIIHNILDMPDNGYALNVLRNFRDEYMLNHPETYIMLVEYDIIGPKIAKALQNDPLNKIIAKTFYETHIKPITNLVNMKEYDIAIIKYQDMTNKLKNYYQIDTTIDKKLDIKTKTLGKARA